MLLRTLPLIALLLAAACSKEPAEATGTAGEAAAPQAEAVKPVPAELPPVLARVNGEDVTRQELEEFVQNLEARAGGPVPAEQRDQIYRNVIEQLVGYKLLEQESKARKVVVPDAEVQARIDQIKAQFPSEDLFMQALIERKMTLEQMRADARQDLAIGKLIDDEIASRIAVTPEQLQDFYAKNPEQFTESERVRASHILFAVPEGADAAAKAKVQAQAEAAVVAAQALAPGLPLLQRHDDIALRRRSVLPQRRPAVPLDQGRELVEMHVRLAARPFRGGLTAPT